MTRTLAGRWAARAEGSNPVCAVRVSSKWLGPGRGKGGSAWWRSLRVGARARPHVPATTVSSPNDDPAEDANDDQDENEDSDDKGENEDDEDADDEGEGGRLGRRRRG
jgi:hypothetical protein